MTKLCNLITVIQAVMPYILADRQECFGRQVPMFQRNLAVPSSVSSAAMEMEAESSSGTLVSIYQI